MLLISTALCLGFLHGLGADHLMGIAALSVASPGDTAAARRSRAFGIAVRFAIGHALLLAVGAGALVLLGWSLPLAFERGGEMLGGILLIVLGAVGLWGVAAGRVYGHTHPHAQEPITHWHLHIGRQDRHPMAAAHSHLPTIVGAAFAVSSLRALALLGPFGSGAAGASLPLMLLLVAVFAVGIVMSMALFGVAFAGAVSSPAIAGLGRASAVVMACSSIALGVFWIASNP